MQEVLVIDDHSSDSTAKIAEIAGARVVTSSFKKSAALAILTGISVANTELMVTLDADGQHPPSVIPSLLQPILRNEADFVIGRRQRLPPSERLPRKAVSTIIGEDYDVGSGFRAFRRKNLIDMKPEDIGFCGCGSFLLYARSQGARLLEIPYRFLPRDIGRSKFSNVKKNQLHRDQANFLLRRYASTGNQA